MDGRGISDLSVRRPWLAAVMSLLIVIAGIGALFGIEVRELPDVDRPIVSVRANYPGASPTTVDAEVSALVEGAVARVAGVEAVRTSSEEGNFRMRVEFSSDRDLANAANDVREAVSRVEPRLPDGVEDLFVVKSEEDADPVVDVAVWSDERSIGELTRLVEDAIATEFTAVDGVAEVVLFGDRQRVLRVEVRPERLAAFGLSIGEVAEVLRAAQFDVPVGSFSSGPLEVLVRADATVAEPRRIEELLLDDRVRLGDVAEVYFGLATPDSIARLDGRQVVSLGIVRQAQSNTVRISDEVGAAIERLKQRFPDLGFAVTSDDAVFIKGAIAEVLKTLGAALLIVVAVIWLFFGRLGATLIPAVTIPIALVGSVAGIYLMGFSINLITLLALVLATGLVVDDAIVVTENIQRRRQEGMGRRAAAVLGSGQVFFAVIATTVTLIAVFVPISFLPGDAGRLFTEFGFVLAVTVAISSFVALTMCPMLASLSEGLGRGGGLFAGLGGRLAALFDTRDALGPEVLRGLDSFARDLIGRTERLTPPPSPGLFTDAGARFDPAQETGLAGRLAVGAAVDPSAGGALFRLRTGPDAALPSAVAQAPYLAALGPALSAQEATVPNEAPRDLSSHAARLSSRAAQARLTAESAQSFAAGQAGELREMELRRGVDSDAELQRLILVEQAFSANARMIQTLDDMMQTLLRI